MSSPLSKNKGGWFGKILIQFHKNSSHSNRISLLRDEIHQMIMHENVQVSQLSILDVGCGDMSLAEGIAEKIPNSLLSCIDLYRLEEQHLSDVRWHKYKQFNGRDIPFEDNSFDYILFADVLHHCQAEIENLLSESVRCGKYIIIKDHFEYGYWSRWILKLMDIIGNWGYGVSIPQKYFRVEEFDKLLKKHNLETLKVKRGIDLYKHLPFVSLVCKPEYQFVALLKVNK